MHKSFSQKVAEVASEVIVPVIEPIVEDYLENNPPITIDEIKSDPDIADSLDKKHSNTNDLSPEQKTALTGGNETNLHTHPGGGGGLTQQQIEGLI